MSYLQLLKDIAEIANNMALSNQSLDPSTLNELNLLSRIKDDLLLVDSRIGDAESFDNSNTSLNSTTKQEAIAEVATLVTSVPFFRSTSNVEIALPGSQKTYWDFGSSAGNNAINLVNGKIVFNISGRYFISASAASSNSGSENISITTQTERLSISENSSIITIGQVLPALAGSSNSLFFQSIFDISMGEKLRIYSSGNNNLGFATLKGFVVTIHLIEKINVSPIPDFNFNV